MYKCLNQNQDISANVANFIPLDNNSLLERLENLFKVETIAMTNLLIYDSTNDVTEWYAPLPAHIKKEKVISITNINQKAYFEYCNLDIVSNHVRVGCKVNNSSTNPSEIKALIAYFT